MKSIMFSQFKQSDETFCPTAYEGYANEPTFRVCVLCDNTPKYYYTIVQYPANYFDATKARQLLETYGELLEDFTVDAWYAINWQEVADSLNDSIGESTWSPTDHFYFHPSRTSYAQILRLFDWHGGQWSSVYSLASTLKHHFEREIKVNVPAHRLTGRSSANIREFWLNKQELILACIKEIKNDKVKLTNAQTKAKYQTLYFLFDKLVKYPDLTRIEDLLKVL